MYDWHKTHPEKSTRFRMAMEGVTQCRFKHGRFLWCYPTLTDDTLEKPSTLGTHFSSIGSKAIGTETAF